jgi:hypothetical protein
VSGGGGGGGAYPHSCARVQATSPFRPATSGALQTIHVLRTEYLQYSTSLPCRKPWLHGMTVTGKARVVPRKISNMYSTSTYTVLDTCTREDGKTPQGVQDLLGDPLSQKEHLLHPSASQSPGRLDPRNAAACSHAAMQIYVKRSMAVMFSVASRSYSVQSCSSISRMTAS